MVLFLGVGDHCQVGCGWSTPRINCCSAPRSTSCWRTARFNRCFCTPLCWLNRIYQNSNKHYFDTVKFQHARNGSFFLLACCWWRYFSKHKSGPFSTLLLHYRFDDETNKHSLFISGKLKYIIKKIHSQQYTQTHTHTRRFSFATHTRRHTTAGWIDHPCRWRIS